MAALDDLDEVIERCQRALDEFVKGNPEPMKAMFSQLGPIAWARAFDALREAKGAKDGHGGDRGNQHTGGKPAETTFAKLAAEQGVSEDTARRRLKLARDLEPYPETAEKVDKGRATAVQRLLRGYEVGSCAAGVSF